MGESVSWGGLMGGIGLFLVGMMLFEDTIKEMGKGRLKHILQRYTSSIGKSVGVGIVQTFLFQSSSIVTMITLGFVGAGIIGMYNGLGVVLGANIGTTLTPWLVYLLGFKIQIEQYMLPLIGVAGLTLMIANHHSVWYKAAKFMVGFALLFLGLDYMKTSVETLAQVIDLGQYAHWGIIGFTLIGALITTIMQTSTGVTIIALTALSSGVITLDIALGIVIGANIGSALSTGMMGFLSSSHGQHTKKQISLSHVIFNCSTAVIVLICFQPIKSGILMIVGNDDPELVVSIFHTLFNIILLMIWIPCLKRYSKHVSGRFVNKNGEHHFAITQINTTISEEVMQALHTDMGYVLGLTIEYNTTLLSPQHPTTSVGAIELYGQIKQAESVLLSEMSAMSHVDYSDRSLFATIENYNNLLLTIIASSKYLKDIIDHLESIVDADGIEGGLFYECMSATVQGIFVQGKHILDQKQSQLVLEELIHDLSQQVIHHQQEFSSLIATHTDHSTSKSLVSELIKTHHYVILSCTGFIDSLYEYKSSLLTSPAINKNQQST